MKIRVDPLLSILAVADHGSVSRAAQALHTSQPALSRTLREFEGLIGLELFERGPRGVTPTRAGEVLLGRARAIRAEARRAEREIASLRQGSAVPLRIGVVPVLAVRLFTDAVLALRDAWPELRVHVETRPQEDLHARLRMGELDVVIGPEPEEPGDPPLVCERVFVDDLVVVAGRANPRVQPGPVPLASLRGERWVLPLSGSPERRRIDGLFRAAGVEVPIADFETDDVAVQTLSVACSDRVAVLPRSIALTTGLLGISIATFEPRTGEGTVAAVWRANVDLPEGSATLVASLRDGFEAAGERA